MQCVLHEPRIEEGMAAFLGGEVVARIGSSAETEQMATVQLPQRRGKVQVERCLLMAVLEGKKIRVRYWSVNSGKASWRWLVPHAFGHDGYRWHVRAWCAEREDYLDFVVSRIEKADFPCLLDDQDIPSDADWETLVSIKVKANSKLSEKAKRAIEMDYGIRRGSYLTVKTRKAMEGYLLDHLHINRDARLPAHFELA